MIRIALHCSLLLCLASFSRAQTILFREDFESGLSNWTSTSLWHLASETDPCLAPALPLPSGSSCAWFGNPSSCNYQNLNSGLLQMIQPFTMPAIDGHSYLHFRQFVATENCSHGDPGKEYDISVPQISTNGGQSWTTLLYQCSSGGWYSYRAPLNLPPGTNVLLRFSFDSVDHINDSTLGWLIDDVEIRIEPGVPYCEVTGTGFCSCPCAFANDQCHPSQVGGCKNSAGHFGELCASGTASVLGDDVVMTASDLLPSTTVVFLQGDVLAQAVVFGDGLRCVGGSLLRIGIVAAIDGSASFPAAQDPPVSVAGLLPASGGTRGYQAYYRDGAHFCTPAGFNVSNAYQIDWQP